MFNLFKSDRETVEHYGITSSSSNSAAVFAISNNPLKELKKLVRQKGGELSSLNFEQSFGSRVDDFLLYTPGVYFVSDKFKQVLEKNGFTGWECLQVSLTTKDGVGLDKYYLLKSFGCARKVKKHDFEDEYSYTLDKWDGNDFYYPEGTLALTVTPEVKEQLEASGITGVEFKKSRVYVN